VLLALVPAPTLAAPSVLDVAPPAGPPIFVQPGVGGRVPLFEDERQAIVDAVLASPAVARAANGRLIPPAVWRVGVETLRAAGRVRPDGPVCAAPPASNLVRNALYGNAPVGRLSAGAGAGLDEASVVEALGEAPYPARSTVAWVRPLVLERSRAGPARC
jgi:hypothetical protein